MTYRDLSGTHVLVVDDDVHVRKELQELLEAKGAVVHQAASRIDALGKIAELSVRELCPQAVVMDWILNPPDSKESQFYRLLGRNERNTSLGLIQNIRRINREIPIVVWSYFNDQIPNDIPKAFGLQVVDKHRHHSIDGVVHLLCKDETIQDRRHRSGETTMTDSERLRLGQAAPEEQEEVARTAAKYLNRPDVARAMAEATPLQNRAV